LKNIINQQNLRSLEYKVISVVVTDIHLKTCKFSWMCNASTWRIL